MVLSGQLEKETAQQRRSCGQQATEQNGRCSTPTGLKENQTMPGGTKIVSISYLKVAATLAGTTCPAISNTASSVRSTFEEKSRGQISQVNPNSGRKVSKFYWQSLATFDNKFWIKTLISANTFNYEVLKEETEGTIIWVKYKIS